MTDDPVPRGGFRWKCPLCGKSRLNATEDESGEENAIAAIRTHIVASDGADHGPRGEYPAGFDPRGLAEHVVRVDGSRR